MLDAKTIGVPVASRPESQLHQMKAKTVTKPGIPGSHHRLTGLALECFAKLSQVSVTTHWTR